MEFRAGACALPLELDSKQVAALSERVPEAIYQWREKTLALPVPDDAAARLGAPPDPDRGRRRRDRLSARLAHRC